MDLYKLKVLELHSFLEEVVLILSYTRGIYN